MKGFKEFILRGNAVELAIGVVVGAAFNDIVKSFVSNILTPSLSLIGGQPDFSKYSFTLNNVTFSFGAFLNSLISFLIIATAVYFLVIVPMNRLTNIVRLGKSPDPTTKKCDFCYMDIPIKATRCPNCTSKLEEKKS